MPSRVVRTRNAPSPTGYAHLATIYQSLFDKAYALKHNGKFVLRVENTDKKRYKREWEDAIYEAIDWAGVSPDESPIKGGPYGPYRQSERLDLYKKHVLELVEKGCAYYCFCSAERLEEMRAQMQKKGLPAMYDKYCRSLSNEEVQKNLNSVSKYVIRMKIPENTKIVCEDLVRGKIEFDSSTVDDQVILKSDGFPTYHFLNGLLLSRSMFFYMDTLAGKCRFLCIPLSLPIWMGASSVKGMGTQVLTGLEERVFCLKLF